MLSTIEYTRVGLILELMGALLLSTHILRAHRIEALERHFVQGLKFLPNLLFRHWSESSNPLERGGPVGATIGAIYTLAGILGFLVLMDSQWPQFKPLYENWGPTLSDHIAIPVGAGWPNVAFLIITFAGPRLFRMIRPFLARHSRVTQIEIVLKALYFIITLYVALLFNIITLFFALIVVAFIVSSIIGVFLMLGTMFVLRIIAIPAMISERLQQRYGWPKLLPRIGAALLIGGFALQYAATLL